MAFDAVFNSTEFTVSICLALTGTTWSHSAASQRLEDNFLNTRTVGMQPGVCFGKKTNLLTGERLVLLVETDVYRRQKRFVLQAETNVLALPKLWPESSGKRKQTLPMRKSKFRGSKQTFFRNVSLKLETQNKLRWS